MTGAEEHGREPGTAGEKVAPLREEHEAAARNPRGISAALTWMLAAACGASVANLYYAQPLLSTIARTFRVCAGATGLMVTFSQIGYAVGLALLVPLGDLVSRRLLVPAALVVTSAALTAAGLAPTMELLDVVALVIGLGSVAAQMLVPLAAGLASDAARGRVVGTVMTGLLLGILLARTVSGVIAGLAGWRYVFAVAALGTLAVAVALARRLPTEAPRPKLAYRELLVSTFSLFIAEPLLRRRAVFGALSFAAFSVFWTTAAFMLSGPPFHESDSVIGLFGLVGAAGALCANVAGRLADRGLTGITTIVFSVALASAFWPTFEGRYSIPLLIVGIVILDIGGQGLHITNQSLIYRLEPAARSRVNASYMVCYFVGGAAGSAMASFLYATFGWAGVCVLGGTIGLFATVASVADLVRPVTLRNGPGAS